MDKNESESAHSIEPALKALVATHVLTPTSSFKLKLNDTVFVPRLGVLLRFTRPPQDTESACLKCKLYKQVECGYATSQWNQFPSFECFFVEVMENGEEHT